jgi:hypothetical protein
MKIRKDFVTNSSSSSFVISKRHLDDDQILAINEHISLGKKMGMSSCSFENMWDIDENDEYIGGYTYQDNFDMHDFLDDIGVSTNVVHWGYDIWDDNIPKDHIEENWRKLLHEDS